MAGRDPNLILTLQTDHRSIKKAWEHPHTAEKFTIASTREQPLNDTESTSDDDSQSTCPSESRLQLTFDRPPRNITRGFSFGTSKKRCDILIETETDQKISGLQFYITMDEWGRLVLIDRSKYGTAVGYEGWGGNLFRTNFKWILAPDKETTIHLRNGAILQVEFATHENCQAEYNAKVMSYLNDSSDPTMALGALDIPTADPSLPFSPNQGPIYYPIKTLGRGGFGIVQLVRDVSTGVQYASKEPLLLNEGADTRKFLSNEMKKEVDVMKQLSHPHIVRYHGFVNGPSAQQLLMEYLPLGNLNQQHEKESLSNSEISHLLLQSLDAINYLHLRDITHRDIKPKNILVKGRKKMFHIKLADFGLSKVVPELQTNCGTPVYTPPEIPLVAQNLWNLRPGQRTTYDNKVDIWSLGVVILEFFKKLPSTLPNPPYTIRKVIEKLTETQPINPMFSFLERMLRIDSFQRPSARDCLSEAHCMIWWWPENDPPIPDAGPKAPIITAKEAVAQSPVLCLETSKRKAEPLEQDTVRSKHRRVHRQVHPTYASIVRVVDELGLQGFIIPPDGNEATYAIKILTEEFSLRNVTRIRAEYNNSNLVCLKGSRITDSQEVSLIELNKADGVGTAFDLTYRLVARFEDENTKTQRKFIDPKFPLISAMDYQNAATTWSYEIQQLGLKILNSTPAKVAQIHRPESQPDDESGSDSRNDTSTVKGNSPRLEAEELMDMTSGHGRSATRSGSSGLWSSSSCIEDSTGLTFPSHLRDIMNLSGCN
ncbi:hypothetical protein FQN57_006351 [Myotisia sp. PD_48]|nr:hypothetical protein FQN57_006351 [Myotisia sp. PD_48]